MTEDRFLGISSLVAMTHLRNLATRFVRVLQSSASLQSEGAGNAGRPSLHLQPHVRMRRAHERSHHRYSQVAGIPCAMVLTVYFRALPGEPGFVATVIGRKSFCRLDPSVGGSGPHDFAVRLSPARLALPSRPSHPAPTSVTTAKRPSCERGTAIPLLLCLPIRKAKYFSPEG
jgi:hypothetical protein